jgi:hypothetical protein
MVSVKKLLPSFFILFFTCLTSLDAYGAQFDPGRPMRALKEGTHSMLTEYWYMLIPSFALILFFSLRWADILQNTWYNLFSSLMLALLIYTLVLYSI